MPCFLRQSASMVHAIKTRHCVELSRGGQIHVHKWGSDTKRDSLFLFLDPFLSWNLNLAQLGIFYSRPGLRSVIVDLSQVIFASVGLIKLLETKREWP